MENKSKNAMTAFKRIISFVLTAALLFTFLPGGIISPIEAKAASVTWNVGSQGRLVIPAGSTDDYVITGTLVDPTTTPATLDSGIVDIASGYNGTITLSNLHIRTKTDRPAIYLRGNGNNANPSTRVNLVVSGNNYVHSASEQVKAGNGTSNYSEYAGITVSSGAQITIDGTGVLEARGNHVDGLNSVRDQNGGGAGIGGGGGSTVYSGPLQGGNIHIKGGTINAYGSFHAAAIGGGIAPYHGTVVVSGGVVNCHGGAHGAGIGGGCANTGAGGAPSSGSYGNGVVAVLPPSKVAASGGPGGTKYLVGNVKEKVYIGDPSSPLVNVRTSETTKNADIFIDLRNIGLIGTALNNLSIPTTQVDPGRILFGNTGADGLQAKLNMESGAANKVNFFTEAQTAPVNGLQYDFLAVEQAITASTNIVLQAPVPKLTATFAPPTVPNLSAGYTTIPAGNTITVTIQNTGNVPLKDIVAAIEAAYAGSYQIVTPPALTTLAINQSTTFTVAPKLGLPQGTHHIKVNIDANGISGTGASAKDIAIPQINVTLPTQIVTKSATAGGTITASPDSIIAPKISNITQVAITGTRRTGAVSPDPGPGTIDALKYIVKTTNTAPTAAEWTTATSLGSGDVASVSGNVTFPATPKDSKFYVFTKMETQSDADVLKMFEYNIDRTNPTVASITAPANVNASAFDVTVVFSEPISALDATKFVVTNATKGTVTGVGVPTPDPNGGAGQFYTSYKTSLTPSTTLAEGSVITFKVDAVAGKDAAGNDSDPSSAGQNLNINYSNVRPNPTLTTPDTTVNNSFTVTLDFDKAISVLPLPVAGDFTITGGTIGTIAQVNAGTKYTVQVNVPSSGDGEIKIKLPADKLKDISGNKNTESNELVVKYRNTKIAPVLTTSIAPTAYANGAFTVNIKYSIPVTGLTVAGISISNAGDFNAPVLAGSGDTYTLTLTPKANVDNNTNISIAGGATIKDEYGNDTIPSNILNVKYDNIRPQVTTITSPVTSVGDENFTVNVTFDEAVKDLTAASLDLKNCTVVSITPNSGLNTGYAIVLKPSNGLSSGDKISVGVKENGVTDKANNGNISSATSGVVMTDITYNNVSPSVNSWSFNAGQEYVLNQPSVTLTINSNGQANKNLYADDGTAITTANIATYASSFIEINGGATTYTATMVTVGDNHTITLTPTGGFNTGDYKVDVLANKVKNMENNMLKATDRSFTVRIPTIDPGNPAHGLNVTPKTMAYTGAIQPATVTVTGEYLDKGTLIVHDPILNQNVTIPATSISSDGKVATYTAQVPINDTNAAVTYTFSATLNGATVKVIHDNVIVDAATPGVNGAGEGIFADPLKFDYKGGNTTLNVIGMHLHNYDLKIQVVETGSGTTVDTLTVTVTAPHGKSDIKLNYLLPRNDDSVAKNYEFTLMDGATSLNKSVTVEVGPSVPQTTDFTVSNSATTNGTANLVMDDKAGVVYFTVDGLHMHNFPGMTVTEISPAGAPAADALVLSGLASDNNKATAKVTLPANRTLNDITYTYELKNADVVRTVTIVVEKPEAGPTAVASNPTNLSQAGGTSTITVTGKNMEIGSLELKLIDGPSGVGMTPVLTMPNAGTEVATSDVTITFPAWQQGLRNDIYTYEVYFDGKASGLTTTVEIGDFLPNYQSIDAKPNFFPTIIDTLYGNGVSTITVHGNYLYNFGKIEIYDHLFEEYYTVNAVKDVDDMTASTTVKVPTAEGVFTYELVIDGQKTGVTTTIGVGVTLGMSGTELVPIDPQDPTGQGRPAEKEEGKDQDDKYWKGTGGGSKGRGFTGRLFVGFDVLEYQSKEAAFENPQNPVVVVPNMFFITRDQIDIVASSAREGSRLSSKTGDGRLLLVFDTTYADNDNKLEGRLYVDTFYPMPDLYTGVFVVDSETKFTRELFKKEFGNSNLEVVSLGMNDSFYHEVEVAANLDLAGRGFKTTDKLYFYVMDRSNGDYEPLKDPQYYIDDIGFVHFFTEQGGDVIITDTKLSQETGSFNLK